MNNNYPIEVSAFLIDITYVKLDGTELTYRGQFYSRNATVAIQAAREFALAYLRPVSITSIFPAVVL